MSSKWIPVVALAAVVLSSCSSPPPPKGASLNAGAARSRESSTTERLASAVAYLGHPSACFYGEPSGDISYPDKTESARVYALVNGFDPTRYWVAFDVYEYSVDEPGSGGDFRLDGEEVVRNRYKHTQWMPLSDDATIVLSNEFDLRSRVGDRVRTDTGTEMKVLTREQFRERYLATPVGVGAGCWIVIRGNRVVALIVPVGDLPGA